MLDQCVSSFAGAMQAAQRDTWIITELFSVRVRFNYSFQVRFDDIAVSLAEERLKP